MRMAEILRVDDYMKRPRPTGSCSGGCSATSEVVNKFETSWLGVATSGSSVGLLIHTCFGDRLALGDLIDKLLDARRT
jgi:hypothetical protein